MFHTAPTPVVIAQPMRAATSMGTSREIGIAPASGTTVRSAIDATARYENTSSPEARLNRVVPSSITHWPAFVPVQAQARPARQWEQRRHE